MKAFISLTLLLTSLNLIAAEMLYTEQSFPYKDLVQRTDSIKIYYIEKSTQVRCRVQVLRNEQQWQSPNRVVSHKHFSKHPLKSCLGRQQAKEILATTFK